MPHTLWTTPLPLLSKAIPTMVPTPLPTGGVLINTVYNIGMYKSKHIFHSNAIPVPTWCYRDMNNPIQTYLGPVIEATAGMPVYVTWTNNLPATLPFPYVLPAAPPGTMMMALPKPGHTVTHLHGAHCPPNSDGYPEDYLHSTIGMAHGPTTATYQYPNGQPGATLWYHDHTMGITRLNVYAGLAGLYLLRDPNEAALNLPQGNYEIPLVLQDRMFNPAATKMAYAVTPAQPEFFGDHMVVNGAVWPFLNTEPRRYRLRIVNGSNSRFYRLRLLSLSVSGVVPKAYQIGSDGGFLAAPVQVMTAALPLILAPGERADVIIDCSACLVNDTILLENDAFTPFDPNPAVTLLPADPMRNVLKLVIVAAIGVDTSVIPVALPSNFTVNIGGAPTLLSNEVAVRTALATAGLPPIKVRKHKLIENKDLITGNPTEVLLNNLGFHHPITEDPSLDDIEIWEINNTTLDVHPIHIHLVQFLVLSRVSTTAAPAFPVDANELGWKDTVRCNPGEVTRIIMRFTDYVGRYVWHCHMLEHEDHDMMRPLLVRT